MNYRHEINSEVSRTTLGSHFFVKSGYSRFGDRHG